jgi:hypothetical protein
MKINNPILLPLLFHIPSQTKPFFKKNKIPSLYPKKSHTSSILLPHPIKTT